MGDSTLIIGGHDVFTWGSASKGQVNLASSARSLVTTAWLMEITRGTIPGGLDALEMFMRDLPSARAQSFGPKTKLKHVLSYTSLTDGAQWSYSCRDHWPWQHEVFEQVVGQSVASYLNRELFTVISGMHADMVADGTCRVYGSVRAQARWGYLWLQRGNWNGQQLVDPALVDRSVAGGPNGDGRPEPREGYQIHLFKGQAWSEGPAPGVPDDAYMAAGAADISAFLVVPSLNMVCPRWRTHGVSFGRFASEICRAVSRGQSLQPLTGAPDPFTGSPTFGGVD